MQTRLLEANQNDPAHRLHRKFEVRILNGVSNRWRTNKILYNRDRDSPCTHHGED